MSHGYLKASNPELLRKVGTENCWCVKDVLHAEVKFTITTWCANKKWVIRFENQKKEEKADFSYDHSQTLTSYLAYSFCKRHMKIIYKPSVFGFLLTLGFSGVGANGSGREQLCYRV